MLIGARDTVAVVVGLGEGERVLVFLNVYKNESVSVRNYHRTFHLELFRVSYFPQGTEVFLLAYSSKDNIRIADKGRDGFLWL